MTSLKARLYFLLAAALTSLGVVGAMGMYNARLQAEFGTSANQITEVLRAQMQADMMHDAIRGDVLNALRLAANGSPSAQDRSALEGELAEHSRELRDGIAKVAQQATPSIQTQMGPLRIALDAYVASAKAAVAAAFTGKAQGEAAWHGFEQQFVQLEGSLEKLGDSIEQAATDLRQEAHDSGERIVTWNWAVILVSAMLLLAGGVTLVNRILRQLGGDPLKAWQLARDITDGKLQARAELKAGDSSSLMASMQALAERISTVIDGLQTLAREQREGHMQARMATAQLPGDFQRLAREVNALVEAQNHDLMQVSSLVGAYARQDFSQPWPSSPATRRKSNGKWMLCATAWPPACRRQRPTSACAWHWTT